MNGLDLLLASPVLPKAGARVGFLGHHASVDQYGTHAVDRLQQRAEWNLTKLFSPEHGFFGKAGAGEQVGDSLHPTWGLPVHSLYGEHRSPPAEWLEDLDLMVVDLQDLGVRCYTYASTLRLMMRACAGVNLPMLVLDRKTPLAGLRDGPGLDPARESFVGMIDLPVVYGLGQGELATFLQAHHSELRKLDLTVFRSPESSQEAFSNWIPPSPAIVSAASAQLYPVTVWSEAVPNVNVDRGGRTSFRMWAMPDFPETLLKHPPEFCGMSVKPIQGNQPGYQFSVEDVSNFRPVTNAVRLLCALRDCLGAERLFARGEARPDFFDQLMGTASVREEICAGSAPKTICSRWK